MLQTITNMLRLLGDFANMEVWYHLSHLLTFWKTEGRTLKAKKAILPERKSLKMTPKLALTKNLLFLREYS